MDIRVILALFAICYFAVTVIALPVKEEKKPEVNEKKMDAEMDDLGLEYGRYLQQVVEALEQDKDFAKKLENVSQEEIKNGAIAKELDLVNHVVRNKLDELKRIEIERLRQLAKKEKQLEDNNGNDSDRRWRTLGADTQALDAEHLDHLNPHSFEAQDLQKLILSATKDLEELDAKRKEDFKSYEMEKELRYRETLINMTEDQRQETIKKHDQMEEKHKQHPKVHHPGSKKQLEQVWEEQDHMPREEFNPKIFFTMHDINGDGFLDPQEVEAILTVEVKKMYSSKNSEDDVNEMQEEFHRMREHIYKEADINRDGLISKKEFLEFTHRMEFERDDGWKGLDETQVYSEEDLKKFQEKERKEYERREQYSAYQQQPQYYPEGYHPQQQGGGHPSQYEHYIPDPHQMTQQQWQQQQQYYQQQFGQLHPQQQQAILQQQLHAQQFQQQIPNQQLHQMQGQQQQGHPMAGQPMIDSHPNNVQQMQGHPGQPMIGHPDQQQHPGNVQQMGGQPIGHQGQLAGGQQIGSHPMNGQPIQQQIASQQQMGGHPQQPQIGGHPGQPQIPQQMAGQQSGQQFNNPQQIPQQGQQMGGLPQQQQQNSQQLRH